MTDLAAALVSAMAELENVPKTNTAKVGAYSYSYADLGDTLTYVRPVLARHGLGVSQEVSGDGATVTVVTVIWHESGESYRTPGLTMRTGGTPQETGSAITYARRYSLLPALGLATEDDDGAQASQTKPHQIEARDRKTIAAHELAVVTSQMLHRIVPNTPEAAAFKEFAAGRKYSLPALAADPEWRAEVDQYLHDNVPVVAE